MDSFPPFLPSIEFRDFSPRKSSACSSWISKQCCTMTSGRKIDRWTLRIAISNSLSSRSTYHRFNRWFNRFRFRLCSIDFCSCMHAQVCACVRVLRKDLHFLYFMRAQTDTQKYTSRSRVCVCMCHCNYVLYPPGIKDGVLENGPFISDFPSYKPRHFGDFPASHVWLLVSGYPQKKNDGNPPSDGKMSTKHHKTLTVNNISWSGHVFYLRFTNLIKFMRNFIHLKPPTSYFGFHPDRKI